MNLLKFMRAVFTLTLMCLVYIHLQMNIFDLAYQGRFKEKQIKELSDTNGHLNSNILRLTSVNHLGVKALAEGSDLRFMDGANVFKPDLPDYIRSEEVLASSNPIDKKTSMFANLFSFITQAEATPVK